MVILHSFVSLPGGKSPFLWLIIPRYEARQAYVRAWAVTPFRTCGGICARRRGAAGRTSEIATQAEEIDMNMCAGVL